MSGFKNMVVVLRAVSRRFDLDSNQEDLNIEVDLASNGLQRGVNANSDVFRSLFITNGRENS